MIPAAYITEWKNFSPWANEAHVEQDLILSRAIIEIFNNSFLKKELAFRGGTALHKLFFSPAARYSEDIDLVRTGKGPIKPIVDALRDIFEPWLGIPKIQTTNRSFKLMYYFNTERLPITKARIKIEINIEESFSILQRLEKDFSVNSQWFSGQASINTFQFEELIATKLRALYQRKKGRDVFDLWLALQQENFDIKAAVNVFLAYMEQADQNITQIIFEKNLNLKLREFTFLDDIGILLSPQLMRTHAKSLAAENGVFLSAEDGTVITSEGWSLIDAADEIKNRILNAMYT